VIPNLGRLAIRGTCAQEASVEFLPMTRFSLPPASSSFPTPLLPLAEALSFFHPHC